MSTYVWRSIDQVLKKKLVQSVQEIELNIQSFSYLFTLLMSEMK